MAAKGTWRILVVIRMFCILTVSMSVSWLWLCTIVLQGVILTGNQVKSTWYTIIYYLYVISYNWMWIYTYLKIKHLFKKQKERKKQLHGLKGWTGFLNLGIDLLNWIILSCGGCPVPYRRFSSIFGLYPLDASSTRLVMTTKKVPRHCQMSPEG